jgi:plastocyanin domain-containing protein
MADNAPQRFAGGAASAPRALQSSNLLLRHYHFVNCLFRQKSKKTTDVKIPKGAFRITVNKDGFTPQDISFPDGKPIKLAFVRQDAENCADEIIFPELNTKKNCPSDKRLWSKSTAPKPAP